MVNGEIGEALKELTAEQLAVAKFREERAKKGFKEEKFRKAAIEELTGQDMERDIRKKEIAKSIADFGVRVKVEEKEKAIKKREDIAALRKLIPKVRIPISAKSVRKSLRAIPKTPGITAQSFLGVKGTPKVRFERARTARDLLGAADLVKERIPTLSPGRVKLGGKDVFFGEGRNKNGRHGFI